MNGGLVLDNSVVMAWCFEDEADTYADAVLDALLTHEAFVPEIWPLELGNALVMAERRGRLRQADSVLFLNMLSGLPIRVDTAGSDRFLKEVIALARDHSLSTYDASYLDLAMRLGLPIATRDASLRKAAQQCGSPLFAATPT